MSASRGLGLQAARTLQENGIKAFPSPTDSGEKVSVTLGKWPRTELAPGRCVLRGLLNTQTISDPFIPRAVHRRAKGLLRHHVLHSSVLQPSTTYPRGCVREACLWATRSLCRRHSALTQAWLVPLLHTWATWPGPWLPGSTPAQHVPVPNAARLNQAQEERMQPEAR